MSVLIGVVLGLLWAIGGTVRQHHREVPQSGR